MATIFPLSATLDTFTSLTLLIILSGQSYRMPPVSKPPISTTDGKMIRCAMTPFRVAVTGDKHSMTTASYTPPMAETNE